MKNFVFLFLILLIVSTIVKAQTRVKAHETPRPRPQKTAEPTAERTAARARAKLDSIQQVRALAKEIARQMVVEDSVRKVQQLTAQQAEAKPAPRQKTAVTNATASRTTTARPAVAYQSQRRQSQDSYPRGLLIGFRGSLNLNTMNTSGDIDELGYLSTPGGALVFSIPLGNNPFALQLEPGYAERGVKYKFNEVSGQYRYETQGTLRLQYLELPVLFRLQPSIGPLQVILTAGPEVRYLLSGSDWETTVRYAASTGKTISTYTDGGSINLNEVNRFDLELTGGIGVGVPLSFGQVFVDGRYHFGTMNVTKDDKSTGYNRAISINAGVLISLH